MVLLPVCVELTAGAPPVVTRLLLRLLGGDEESSAGIALATARGPARGAELFSALCVLAMVATLSLGAAGLVAWLV